MGCHNARKIAIRKRQKQNIRRSQIKINGFLNDPAFRKRVTDMGITVMGGTPEDVTKFVATEAAKWSELVKSAGVKID